MAFTPCHERALKCIEEFESGRKMSGIRLTSTARMSGAFPLPAELQAANTPDGFLLNKRPFDDSILNQNHSLLKKRRTDIKSNDSDSLSPGDSMILESPWEIRKMKGELIQAHAEISALEERCNQLINLRKGDQMMYDQENKSLKQTIENNKQMIADFELKLKKMRKREQQLKEELIGTNDEKMKSFNILKEKNSALLLENMNLKSTISETELKVKEFDRELNSTKAELNSAVEELKLSNEHVAKLQTQLAEIKVKARQHELDKAALIIAQRKISDLESEAKSFSETSLLLKEQQSKLIRMSEVERQLTIIKAENVHLREASNEILKLNEVVHDMKEKLADLEQTESLLKATKVELGLALNELKEYKSLTRGIIGEGAGHCELMIYLREIQQSNVLANSDLATFKAKLKTAEETNEGMNSNCNNLKAEIVKLKSDYEMQVNTFRRLKKLHAITTWERDDLRKMLDSIQKDTTVVCTDSKVESLERLVDGYRKRLNQIEQELTGGPAVLSPSLPGSSSTVESLKKKNEELTQKIEKLEYELEHRNLKGDFDTRNTKILHLRMNPSAIAIEERGDALEAAKSEVTVLREKIRILQDKANTSQIVNVTQIAADNVMETNSKEISDLREKIKIQETHYQKLVEAFKSTSREFREAINSILGYNVSQNKKLFKVTSLYANAPDQHLLFQLQPDGRMELLETEFSKSVFDIIEEHLQHNHSIPMFLSALTMKLFGMQSQTTILG